MIIGGVYEMRESFSSYYQILIINCAGETRDF